MIYPHEFHVLWSLEIYGPQTARQIVGEHRRDASERARRLSSTLVSLRGRGLIGAWHTPKPKVWGISPAGTRIVRGDELPALREQQDGGEG